MNISEKNQRKAVTDSSRNNIAHNLTINVTENWIESEAINLLLRDHEEVIGDWEYQTEAKKLYFWAGIFNFEFKLKITHPVVGFEKLRCTTLAYYQEGRSRFGTKYTIIINSKYLDSPLYRILRWLLHELIHLWMELYNKSKSKSDTQRSWYHNKQFIEKALACGIITNHSGHDLGHNIVFSNLLLKYGIYAPATEGRLIGQNGSNDESKQEKSKLKPWSCGCTNIWCARELSARCLECRNVFTPGVGPKTTRRNVRHIRILKARKSDLMKIVKNPKLIYIIASKITCNEFSVFGIIQSNQQRRKK